MTLLLIHRRLAECVVGTQKRLTSNRGMASLPIWSHIGYWGLGLGLEAEDIYNP